MGAIFTALSPYEKFIFKDFLDTRYLNYEIPQHEFFKKFDEWYRDI